MTEREKLKKQIDKLIDSEFMDNNIERQDMTPSMWEIFFWGVENMPIKEMKAIIKRGKKEVEGDSQAMNAYGD